LNQALQSSPITTSPTIVALGAIKQLSPNCGYLSFTGSITGIKKIYSLWFVVYSCNTRENLIISVSQQQLTIAN
jgi:hypothetical protein